MDSREQDPGRQTSEEVGMGRVLVIGPRIAEPGTKV